MANLPHITWLKAFEAAARHSSFSAAAAELNLTPAAVSQQIRLLEGHLKVQLFERLPRGVSLTDIGQAYAHPIRKSFVDMETATKGLFGTKKKHVIKVRASISYAALIMAPKLAQFHVENPDIFIQLSTTVWADRFDDETIDIDIRYGHGNWQETNIWHLGHEYAAPACHPDFAASFGRNLTIDKIAKAEVVQIIGSEGDWVKLSEYCGLDLEMPPEWLKADSSLVALQIVMSGVGSTMVRESFAKQYIDAGLLTFPLEHRFPLQQSHFLIVREGVEKREDINLFCNWVSGLYKT